MDNRVRHILSAFLLLGLAFIVLYRPQEPDPPHTLYIASQCRAKGLHAGLGGVPELLLITKVADPLYGYDAEGNITPLLAQELPGFSQGGRVVTVRIKKGVFWPDHPAFKATGGKGRELVIDDVIHTLLRNADPAFANISYNTIDFLKIQGLAAWRQAAVDNDGKADYTQLPAGLRKIDPYTVEIHLDLVCNLRDFTATMALCSHVTPPEGLAYFGYEGVYNNPIGLGPFKLANPYRSNAPQIDFVRNASYYGEPTKLSKFVVKVIGEASTQRLAFEKGELDVIELKAEHVEALSDAQGKLKEEHRKKGWKLLRTSKKTGLSYIAFNTQQKGLDDMRVRQALALTFTPDEYLKEVYKGQGEVHLFAFEGLEGYDATYRSPYRQGGQLEKAKQLIAQADPEGKGFPVYTLLVPEGTVARQRAEYFQLCAQKIGIQIEIKQYQWGDFISKCMEGHSEMDMVMIGEALDWESICAFLKLFYGPYAPPKGFNTSRFNDAEFDTLFEAFKSTQQVDQREKLARKMLMILAEKVPAIPIGSNVYHYLVQPWVKGFKAQPGYASASGAHFVEVDEEEKARRLGRKNRKSP